MIKYSMSTAFAVTAIALVCWPAVAAKAESFKAPGVTGIFTTKGTAPDIGGLGIKVKFTDYVFFDNGEAYKGIKDDIEDINTEEFRREDSKNWASWKKDGQEYFVIKPSGSEKKVKWAQLPADDNESLAGKTYHASSMKTAGGIFDNGITVAGSKTITFLDDSTYTFGSFTGVVGGNITAYRDKNPSEFGKYELSGYRIYLTPDDGEILQTLFYFGRESDGSTDYGFINIGGVRYLLEE